MKGHLLHLVLIGLTLAIPLMGGAQSIIPPEDLLNPDFAVRRMGGAGILSVTTDLLNPLQATGTQSSGNVSITHGARGLVQAGLNLGIASADIQLYASTSTLGDSLIFGRRLEVSTGGLISALNGVLDPLVNTVIGTSVQNSWSSSITVSDLDIQAGESYTISFEVLTGSGLRVDALSSINFNLLANGAPVVDINNDVTLNVLGALTIGPVSDFQNFTFTFQALTDITELTFNFDAAALADVNALGGITGNQSVVTFSGLIITPVPEPGSASLILSGGVALLLRRRNRRPQA